MESESADGGEVIGILLSWTNEYVTSCASGYHRCFLTVVAHIVGVLNPEVVLQMKCSRSVRAIMGCKDLNGAITSTLASKESHGSLR